MAQELKHGLKEVGFSLVETAHTGPQAAQRFFDVGSDVVMMDFQLLRASTMDLFRFFKQTADRPEQLRFILTTPPTESDQEEWKLMNYAQSLGSQPSSNSPPHSKGS